jgi:hypothetical protein
MGSRTPYVSRGNTLEWVLASHSGLTRQSGLQVHVKLSRHGTEAVKAVLTALPDARTSLYRPARRVSTDVRILKAACGWDAQHVHCHYVWLVCAAQHDQQMQC